MRKVLFNIFYWVWNKSPLRVNNFAISEDSSFDACGNPEYATSYKYTYRYEDEFGSTYSVRVFFSLWITKIDYEDVSYTDTWFAHLKHSLYGKIAGDSRKLYMANPNWKFAGSLWVKMLGKMNYYG